MRIIAPPPALYPYPSLSLICLLQNQNNFDLFNMRRLKRVWRCRQTDLILDEGGVKIRTSNLPLSPLGLFANLFSSRE